MKDEHVKTKELEKQIKDKEGVRVVIRADVNKDFPSYPHKRMYKNSGLVSSFRRRIEDVLGDTPYELVDGYGEDPHGNTKMGSLRSSYEDD